MTSREDLARWLEETTWAEHHIPERLEVPPLEPTTPDEGLCLASWSPRLEEDDEYHPPTPALDLLAEAVRQSLPDERNRVEFRVTRAAIMTEDGWRDLSGLLDVDRARDLLIARPDAPWPIEPLR